MAKLNIHGLGGGSSKKGLVETKNLTATGTVNFSVEKGDVITFGGYVRGGSASSSVSLKGLIGEKEVINITKGVGFNIISEITGSYIVTEKGTLVINLTLGYLTTGFISLNKIY